MNAIGLTVESNFPQKDHNPELEQHSIQLALHPSGKHTLRVAASVVLLFSYPLTRLPAADGLIIVPHLISYAYCICAMTRDHRK